VQPPLWHDPNSDLLVTSPLPLDEPDVAASAGVLVTERRDVAVFDDPVWQEMATRSTQWSPFSSAAYQKAWWTEFGHTCELSVLVMEHGDRVVGLAPLCRDEWTGLVRVRALGGVALTDYGGPLCAPEAMPEVAAGLVSWFEREVPRGFLHLRDVRPELGLSFALLPPAEDAGLELMVRRDSTTALLPLPDSWDAYTAALPSKHRHELRRKLRRLERQYADATVRRATEATLERDLGSFVALHRQAIGRKGAFMRAARVRFFTALAESFDRAGWLRLNLLEADGSVLAATFGFTVRDVFYLYNMAFDPRTAAVSPGIVLVARVIQEAIAEGVRTFDFLRGAERYKFDLGAQPLELEQVRLARRPVA
jgi:CelD/BcsL family acetyltransferase involved in cellulose biosynthesis